MRSLWSGAHQNRSRGRKQELQLSEAMNMNFEKEYKHQKIESLNVESLNDAFAWKNALDQRVIFLDHVEQLIKIFDLYPKDFLSLQTELRTARDKTKWSIQECRKQFAYTRQRFASGFDSVDELSEGVMI